MDDCEVYWDSNEQNIQFITRQDGDVQKFVFKINDFVKVDETKRMLNNFSTAGKIEERTLNIYDVQVWWLPKSILNLVYLMFNLSCNHGHYIVENSQE